MATSNSLRVTSKSISDVGQGTTVKVYLPRTFDEAVAIIAKSKPAPTPAGSKDELILLVEDDRMREISVAGLRELGYSVIHSSSGTRALELLASNRQVSLLFPDIVMPDMGGRQLADEALKARADLRVLFTTGYCRSAIVHNGVLDARMNFLPKPLTLGQFGKKVREVLT